MRLSDIMANAGLAIYAQVALILFFGVFVLVAVRTYSPSRRAEMDAAARLPLDDGDIIAPRAREN